MSSGFYRMGANLPARRELVTALLRQQDAILGAEDIRVRSGSRVMPRVVAVSLASPSPILVADTRETARQQGFTGDMCTNCGGAHMQVAGHCTVCADCGTTTGCS